MVFLRLQLHLLSKFIIFESLLFVGMQQNGISIEFYVTGYGWNNLSKSRIRLLYSIIFFVLHRITCS